MKRLGFMVGLVTATMAHGRPASAQSPNLKNLRVLPDTLTRRQIMPIMRDIAGGLGVGCIYCHVGDDPSNLRSFEFASDDKPEKRIAREMLRMVAKINSEEIPRAIAELPDSSVRVRVTCATCHRSNTRPVFIEDAITKRLTDDGLEAAIAYYRELREKYYGGYQYDFRSGPLTSVAERLAGQDRFDEALAFARLAIESYPEDSGALYTLGQTQERAGHVDDAIKTMTRALEVAPDNFKEFFR